MYDYVQGTCEEETLDNYLCVLELVSFRAHLSAESGESETEVHIT